MDGTDYTQSTALLRYAGKLGGTYPECPLSALKVDEIVMIAEDVFINLFSTMGENDEVKKVNALSHVSCKSNSDGDNGRLLASGKSTVTATITVLMAETVTMGAPVTIMATLMEISPELLHGTVSVMARLT